MSKQQKYAVGTTVSKVFIDPNTQQPRIYSGKVISYNGTKKNKQYRVRYYDDGDTEDIGVTELNKIVDEGGSGKVRAATDATQQDSVELLIDDDLNGRNSEEEYYEHATQKKRRRNSNGVNIRKGRSSGSGNATLEAMGVTTNHQHQDGSPTQQPPPPSKKRKQWVKKTKESPFEQRMNDLREYKEKHGHVNVKKSEDKSLYRFCVDMRRTRSNPGKSNMIINDDRITSLDALGFEWTGRERGGKSFAQRIEDLRAYKGKHGHINVSQSEDKSLNKFCNHMRQARNNPDNSDRALTYDRIASLDALGFEWTNKKQAAKKSFDQRMEDLRAYKKKHGHVNVKVSEDESLYGFCKQFRYAHKNPGKSTVVLNDGRIASLDALGFDWTVRTSEQSFEQRINDLRAYKGMHGHINVSQNEDKSLYGFCYNVRYAHINPEKSTVVLTDDRIASLEALGFEWSNSGIKSIAEQTDRLPSKKRKQNGQGKVHTATKKKHVSPKCSAKNDKGGTTSSSDQMDAPVTAKGAASQSDLLPTLGHSGNDVSAVSPLAVSTTNPSTSDNLDTIDLITDVETESTDKHPKCLASILLEEKGKRLIQIKQEMAETEEDLKDVREDLDIANDTVTQQAVFTNAWQNKFEELAKLAEAGRVDGAKILEIRNRSIITGQGKARRTDTNDESGGSRIVPV